MTPTITTLPLSPHDDRRARMIKYSITMGIRVVCLVLMLFVDGWWLAVFAAGAIVLPYFAVIIANVGKNPAPKTVLRPGFIEKVPAGASSSERDAGG